MTDIRARLAEAMRGHYLWDECDGGDGHIARCRCDIDNPSITNGVPDGGWMPFAAYFSHLADVLLSLPDIAIVELPEPDSAGGITQFTWRVGNLTVETMGPAVLWPTGHKAGYGQFCDTKHSHNGCRPEWAGALAAALLAAANAAEAAVTR